MSRTRRGGQSSFVLTGVVVQDVAQQFETGVHASATDRGTNRNSRSIAVWTTIMLCSVIDDG
jgi:hypothetical protein